MAGKPNAIPTAAVLIVAVFLLITFWRNNADIQAAYGYSTNTGVNTVPSGKEGDDGRVTVTVTVTAEPTAAAAAKDKTVKTTGTTPAEQAPLAAAAAPVLKESKPRYIFVDLGANGADSLETFLQTPEAKFKYDFPAPKWATHDNAEIFLFEANPIFNDALVQARQKYAAAGKAITIYPSTVVDTKDGMRTFYLDEVNTDNGFWGSSTYKNHPDAVASGGRGTELSGINLSRWLLMNTLPHDFVVVKMDVEGAEYDLVPHMAAMRVWTVVDVLLVEWHTSLPTEEARDAATKGMETLREHGVSCPEYDSAT